MTKYVKSQEALPACLHIWDTTPTQTAIIETKTLDFYPTSALDNSDVVTFQIPGLHGHMLDKVQILSDIRVRTAADGDPAENTNVSTVPHLAAALWRNVDVSIGGTSLTQSFANSYSLFKFWETIIHSTEGTKPLLWEKEGLLLDSVDTKAHSEDVVFYPAAVEGVVPPAVNRHGVRRANRIAQGHTVSLISDLDVPLFNQEKLLPHNLDIQVNLTKNHDGFILMEAEAGTHKVEFVKVVLRCTFQRPNDMVLSIIEERLARENAIYHADKQVLSFHAITQGAQEITIENLFTGTLPYCFLIGVQDRAAFGRARHKNPFSLHPINNVQLFVNGSEHFPRSLERTTREYGVMYDTFLRQLGYPNQGDSLLHHHYKVYPAVAFDLTVDRTQNQHNLNLVKSGTVRLTLGLENEAAQNTVLMVLAWYDQIVEISKDGQLTLV